LEQLGLDIFKFLFYFFYSGGLPKIIKPGRKLVRQGNLMKVSKEGPNQQFFSS
jgi:hypothetical protein